jgi:hypothetical protein
LIAWALAAEKQTKSKAVSISLFFMFTVLIK